MRVTKKNNSFARSELLDAAVYNNLKTELYHSFSDEDISVLKHHGILGMKWGVRRYQNEDGTLTEEGKRRYSKTLYKDLEKADRKGAYFINKIAKEDPALKTFNKKTYDKYKKLMDDEYIKNKTRTHELSDEINRDLMKKYEKYGYENPMVMMEQNPELFVQYYDEGAKEMQKRSASDKVLNETKQNYDNYKKEYEKVTRDYVDELLGEYSKAESKDENAIKFNKNTNEISKQTLGERLTIEIMRNHNML